MVGNWGWAIVLLTLLIKHAFFHLSAASYKSMANMRRLQPRLMALKERYGDDRARMNQAMMELYKTEKIKAKEAFTLTMAPSSGTRCWSVARREVSLRGAFGHQ